MIGDLFGNICGLDHLKMQPLHRQYEDQWLEGGRLLPLVSSALLSKTLISYLPGCSCMAAEDFLAEKPFTIAVFCIS